MWVEYRAYYQLWNISIGTPKMGLKNSKPGLLKWTEGAVFLLSVASPLVLSSLPPQIDSKT